MGPVRTRTASAADLLTVAYERHAGQVEGYLRAGGVEDPEALTQEVFLALYPRLPDVDGGEAGLRSLVFSIAHARRVDHFRAAARSPERREYDPGADPRTVPSAEEIVVARDDERSALERLAILPDDQREALALRVVADLSLEQTAEIMHRSVGAVKQLQHRALNTLRERESERERSR